MKKILVIVGTIIVIMIFIGIYFIGNKESDSARFKKEYESLNGEKSDSGKTIRSINIPKNNPFIYKEAKDIVNMINHKDTFLVYFGFAKCPWCRSVLPNLIKVLDDKDINTIYYVDVLDIRDTKEIIDGKIKTTKDGTDDYYELIKLLDNVLSEYKIGDVLTGEKRIYAPNVVAIVDGKATKLVEGISSKQTDAYMDLTDEMNKESYNDFLCAVNCILDDKKVCTNDKKC